MTRSSAGGTGAAGGVGHEGRCLAWVAVYMLAEESLPEWASGRRVMAIGGQTERPVDDIGFVTDDDGWIMIQAKKRLKIESANSSALAEAMQQLVDVNEVGVPDGPVRLNELRPLNSAIDRVLVLTDHSAPARIEQHLVPVTDRLRDLPTQFPVEDVARNAGERRALSVFRVHLDRLWHTQYGQPISEVDLRMCGRILSVRSMHLVDGGQHLATAREVLKGVLPSPDDVGEAWRLLELEGQRLAEERTFLDRDRLVRRLELKGVVLLPVARLRPDIQRLQSRTTNNMALMSPKLTVSVPESPVAVNRTVTPTVLGADGNIAIVGSPGAGKSVVLHNVATELLASGVDTVVLRADNLRATSGQTREELNLVHELAEVLIGWPGTNPGTLVVDGLDQTRGVDASSWIADLAQALVGSRWRIMATIRTYDLRHGRRWQGIFPGGPVDSAHADPTLDKVSHVLVGDLNEQELDVLRSASPRLSQLLDAADPRLIQLLANPFNIDLAAQLLTDTAVDFGTVRSRVDLLHRYWERRVHTDDEVSRVRTLHAVVNRMVNDRRQTVSLVDLPPGIDPVSLRALGSDGVLRDLPTEPGHADAPIEFAHPVLFDYAVALLALGDTARPMSLADQLDQNPNLAITVRPSLDYRLATVWRDDSQRVAFWELSLRLSSRACGHPLAAAAAARVAAVEIQAIADCQPLADACLGVRVDQSGRWTAEDAFELIYLLAAAVGRSPDNGEAVASVASISNQLATYARNTDNIDLALLAAQLPRRMIHSTATIRPHADLLAGAAIDCMRVALADFGDARRAHLAEFSSRLLAHVSSVDAHMVKEVIEQACRPEALDAWGMRHMWSLIDRIPEIVRVEPQLAVTVGAAVWEYEDPRNDPTSFISSAILPMASSRKQDVESARHQVGMKFAELAAVDLDAATTLLLRIVEAPRMYRWSTSINFDTPPRPRLGDGLRYSAGHDVLLPMTESWITQVQRLAESVDRAPGEPTQEGACTQCGLITHLVHKLVETLQHADVWHHLLLRAATAEHLALARVLLPALTSPNLYAHPSTWIPAAHVACRLSPLLAANEHIAVENAILGLFNVGLRSQPDNVEFHDHLRDRQKMIFGCLSSDSLQTEEARQQAIDAVAEKVLLPALVENQLEGEIVVWDPQPPTKGSYEEFQRNVSEAIEKTQSKDKIERNQSLGRLVDLWTILKSGPETIPEPNIEGFEHTSDDLRLRIAEKLASAPDVLPSTDLGLEIYAVLRAAMPNSAQPATEDGAGEHWDNAVGPAWGSTATTSAIQGLVNLAARQEWLTSHGEELRELLAPFLDSPSPIYRFIASWALPSLRSEPEALFNELKQRLATEEDSHVLAHLLRLLIKFHRTRARDIDQLFGQLAEKPHWAFLTDESAADSLDYRDQRIEIAINNLIGLAVVHKTPYADTLLCKWFSDPIGYAGRVERVTAWLRDFLNPTNTALLVSQERAFELLELSIDPCEESWRDFEIAGNDATDQVREHASRAVKIAESISEAVYFASGAFDNRSSKNLATERTDQARFVSLALPILKTLANVHYPNVTHHIVETIGHISTQMPCETLIVAADAVVDDRGYARESLGFTAALTLAKRYLADHRDLLHEDSTCLSAVRRLLGSFVRVGWNEAIELSEELDDLFG